ncbi:hypothetical protein E2C01_058698 [Portunus trituberculatus]|uniref:Uncharacterized protein n=1 Tax=Portunus trituberculatus TaxID=210409 RepID=A0A5B7GX64_PORTR|nr:hypothetical protein [Portunus trituberculatus]
MHQTPSHATPQPLANPHNTDHPGAGSNVAAAPLSTAPLRLVPPAPHKDTHNTKVDSSLSKHQDFIYVKFSIKDSSVGDQKLKGFRIYEM